jgi:hypothetical protein
LTPYLRRHLRYSRAALVILAPAILEILLERARRRHVGDANAG